MFTTKKTGMTDGKSNTLGGGGRFKQMVASGKSPALAATIGRKIYGKAKMTNMATKGKTSSMTSSAPKPPSSNDLTPTPPTKMKAPKGIAVGNPKAMKSF